MESESGHAVPGQGADLDGAEVHGVFDDEVVVVQAEQRGIDGFVEGPGVGRVLFAQQLFQDGAAIAQLAAQLGAVPWCTFRPRQLGQVFAWRFDGTPWHGPAHDGLQVHGLAHAHATRQAGYGRERKSPATLTHTHSAACGGNGESCGARGGGVRFTLHAFLLQRQRKKTKKQKTTIRKRFSLRTTRIILT